MKCKKCGEELPENSKFCTKCGAKVEEENEVEQKAEEIEERVIEESTENEEVIKEQEIDKIEVEEPIIKEEEKQEEIKEQEDNDKFEVKKQEKPKKKSKLKVILIVLILILAIVAGILYVFKDEIEIFEENDKKSSNSENKIEELQDETNELEDDEENKQEDRTLVTSDKREFNNGLAWSKVDGQFICINTEGKVVFRLSNEYDTVTDFKNPDYALVSNYYNKAIIDKEGRIITTDRENNAFDKIISEDVYAGCAVVYKKVDTYEKQEEQYGIIGFEGNWILELSKDNKFLSNYSIGLTKNIIRNGEKLYFVDTSRKIKIQTGINKYLCEDEKNCYIYTYGNKIAQINKQNGKTNNILNDVVLCGNCSDSLFYAKTSKWDKKKRTTIITNAFYDLNGKKQFEIKETNEIDTITEVTTDFVGIVIRNNGGTRFGTIINKQGEYQFEPIKGVKKLEKVGENKFFISYSNENGEGEYVCNEKGEKLFDATSMTKYENGYAIKDNTNYVDENGMILKIIE
ncbi:MAG: zinc ribbon domain-containing protein [Clostridia bacterium]|nr:zinc ribbon domain-containing protein [Clostridia bacterium]